MSSKFSINKYTGEIPPIVSNTLGKLGLSPTQIKVYISLVQSRGSSNCSFLSYKAGLKLTTTASALNKLVHKKLVNCDIKNKHKYYRTSPLNALISIIDHKQKELLELKEELHEVISFIKQNQDESLIYRPEIKTFEGLNFLKDVLIESFYPGEEVLAYVYLDQELDEVMDDFWELYFKTAKENNISFRILGPDNDLGKDFIVDKRFDANKNIKLVGNLNEVFSVEKHIIGDSVMIFNFSTSVPTAVVINDKSIAKSERSQFEHIWKTTT